MWRVVVAASLAAASLAAASPAASPNATRRERVALAALVVSGHKAADEGFVQQSACAALALFASARGAGGFGGDAVLLAGPLGAGAPHDPATWRSAPPGWRAAHGALVARLAALVGDARDRASVRDLVPWLLDGAYPFLRRNLNYMKLAAYRLEGYDAVLFLDLDVVVTAPLAPLLALSRGAALVGDRADVDRRSGTSRPPVRHARARPRRRRFGRFGDESIALAEFSKRGRSTRVEPFERARASKSGRRREFRAGRLPDVHRAREQRRLRRPPGPRRRRRARAPRGAQRRRRAQPVPLPEPVPKPTTGLGGPDQT